jgi:hypothetical protein
MACCRFASEVAAVGIKAKAREHTLLNRDNVLGVCNFNLIQQPLFLSEGSAAGCGGCQKRKLSENDFTPSIPYSTEAQDDKVRCTLGGDWSRLGSPQTVRPNMFPILDCFLLWPNLVYRGRLR